MKKKKYFYLGKINEWIVIICDQIISCIFMFAFLNKQRLEDRYLALSKAKQISENAVKYWR